MARGTKWECSFILSKNKEYCDWMEATLLNDENSKTPPCQFTEEELRERVAQGMIDAQNGLGCSQKEMKDKYK